jgi:tetratricopeptide (TPR) repeat protein
MPNFPESEYQSGTAHMQLGDDGKAEKAFRRAIALRPDWTLAMTALGSLLVQRNEFIEGEKLLIKVVSLEPQNSPALAALAEVRINNNAPQHVLRELLGDIESLTAKAKPTAAIWIARAALETSLGKTRAARSSLQKAYAIEPTNRSAHFQLAEIAISEGDLVGANELLKRLDTGTRLDAVRLLRARILSHEGKLDLASQQLEAMQRHVPASTQLRNSIDIARTTSGGDLEKHLAVTPNDPSILGRLCTIHRRDAPAKALAFCRRASEAEPGNVAHAVGFGAALVQSKQFEAAVRLFRQLNEIVPENATVHANLATALFIWLTKAQPESAGAYLFLGIIQDQLTDYMDAMANYQQYLRLADASENKVDIEKVNLRLPGLQKLIKSGKGRKIN